MDTDYSNICQLLIQKGELKQQIYSSTLESMELFKQCAKEFEDYYEENCAEQHPRVTVDYNGKNLHEFKLRFAGDVLIFLMHTNIFEFPRDHEVMKTPYIREDQTRSYCGVIHIFNFLSDSFRYNRINDSGYMIGRIFINKDKHFYVEGKRELAKVLNNFNNRELDKQSVEEILMSAIQYTINFDLLVPEYSNLVEISVNDILQIEDQNMILKTGKRLGFRFEPDDK
ncbi:MAG: hypothetical protein J6X65_02945 [Bacteroidales bacterium]|jgi:hypothetical protein|nr:hypothetical protein [Bacteroidales bacterium]